MRPNCPNCGAPAKGPACAYCGTILETPEKVMALAIGKPVSIRFEHDDRVYEFDMVLDRVNMSCDFDTEAYYCDFERVTYLRSDPFFNVSFDGHMRSLKAGDVI